MKKIILGFILSITFLTVFIIKVEAYSPHYLPGGKNYISSDNIIEVNETISSIDSFVIKPYTEYTFSVDNIFFEGMPFEGAICFYDNDVFIIEFSFDNYMMENNVDLNVWSYTFITPAEANYMSFEFRDNGNYEPGTELIGVQLEEGFVPTEYEPYIAGSIIDTSSPFFVGSGTIISYFDQPITISEIQSSLTAYDDIDGDLTDNINLIQDGYSENMTSLGSYDLIFEVSDNSNNKTQLTVKVEVVDVLAPVFSDIGVIKAVYPNVYSVEEIKGMLTASDNYDGNISSNITLVDDRYTEFSSQTGLYEIEYSVTDTSGNTANYVQIIEVVDEEGPIISGNDNISVGYDQELSMSNIKYGLSVVDNYDLSSTIELVLESNSYSTNSHTLGTYLVQFSATDSSGNKTIKDIIINVVDEIGPVVYLNSSIIQVYSDTVLSLPDFAKLLVNTNELSDKQDYFIKIKYDSYSKNSFNPGTYHLYLDFEDGYGKVLSKEFQINVLERDYDYLYIQDDMDISPEKGINSEKWFIIGGVALSTLLSSGIIVFQILKRKSIF
ncbi:MAG: hypothetical protein AB7E16_02140 [Candidatus Izemoplasmatales bacterium]